MASSLWAGITRMSQIFSKMTITNVVFESNRSIYLQACLYRARRGTRERKFKQLKKNKARKAAERIRNQLRWMQQQKKSLGGSSKRANDAHLPSCSDNVYFADFAKFRIYSFEEAINTIRETMHPTLFNEPNTPIRAFVELDMTTDKKTKFFGGFMNVVKVNYPYPHKEDRSVLAFCKLREQMDEALEAGASLAGGQEIITGVKRGRIMLPDFQFVIAHPNILQELSVIRGLLKNKFPELEKGTMSNDLVSLIRNIKTGIRYEAKQDDFEQSYGWIDVQIGTSEMDIEHLEDNFRILLADIRTRGPIRTKDDADYRFMTRCFITNPHHNERLVVNMDDYLEPETIVDSDAEDDEEVAVK